MANIINISDMKRIIVERVTANDPAYTCNILEEINDTIESEFFKTIEYLLSAGTLKLTAGFKEESDNTCPSAEYEIHRMAYNEERRKEIERELAAGTDNN